MRTKKFKAESQRLLELMINSIYTHKEIFLRELISNASDAIDKLYYRALTEGTAGLNREDFSIDIRIDQESRLLSIADNGCGMTRDELETNLGTIAQSGSLSFKEAMEEKEEIDIIGQFGVGFYSAFMVAKQVEVISRPHGSDEASRWFSQGVAGYAIESCTKDGHGTEIRLTLKDDDNDEDYSQFLDAHRIKSLVKKYSDYIRYPIRMDVEHTAPIEGEEDAYETVIENETLNSMVPLWKKNSNEVTEAEYHDFYRDKFNDYTTPRRIITTNAEGKVTYNALLFIPGAAPHNYYSRDYERGLKLYASGVLITDSCKDLIPEYFGFVKGLVDSEDLSLNISREMLQHDRQLKLIATRLERKIKGELLTMLKEKRSEYEEFFKDFGLQFKYGIYQDYGANRELLKDLLMYHSDRQNKLITLTEYVAAMAEDQKYIYYATGETLEKVKALPQMEAVREHGYDILCCTDTVDEFALKMLSSFEEKEFRSVAGADLGLETPDEQQAAAEKQEESKDMLAFLKDSLEEKVKDVRLSQRLKSHPVCLASDGALSLEMEKILNQYPGENHAKAERVLEINSEHPIFQTLTNLYENDRDKLMQYADILYNQALLIEGFSIEDPVAYANTICELLS